MYGRQNKTFVNVGGARGVMDITVFDYKICVRQVVVSIEFSPLSTVELTTNRYQLHNGDYREIQTRTQLWQLPIIFNAYLNANS